MNTFRGGLITVIKLPPFHYKATWWPYNETSGISTDIQGHGLMNLLQFDFPKRHAALYRIQGHGLIARVSGYTGKGTWTLIVQQLVWGNAVIIIFLEVQTCKWNPIIISKNGLSISNLKLFRCLKIRAIQVGKISLSNVLCVYVWPKCVGFMI